MKRIAILFTGGTIGSKKQEQEIDVHGNGSYILLEAYKQQTYCRDDIELTALQPLNILSENLSPEHWRILADTLLQLDWNAYDGIIVTHGSDTIAYTATLFSFLFADITIPLVFTASNYPIADERSNGLRNFGSSIDFVAGNNLSGVFAVYENDQRESLVYLGSRMQQCASFTDQFSSPYNIVYGKMVERKFVPVVHQWNPDSSALRQAGLGFDREQALARLSVPILYIKPYPGLNYSYYQWMAERGKPRAILHDLHHSGTACASDISAYSLPAFVERCKRDDIPLFICPVKNAEDAMYSSSIALIEAGAIVLDKITTEAAAMKLALACSVYHANEDIIRFMKGDSLYFERYETYAEEGEGNE